MDIQGKYFISNLQGKIIKLKKDDKIIIRLLDRGKSTVPSNKFYSYENYVHQ
jgi:hypothetical protein